MTNTISPVVPHDILLLMEKEYSDMCSKVIAEICTHYGLPLDEVQKMLQKKMGMTFEIDETKNNYKYVQRTPKKSDLVSCDRCIANLFDFQTKTPRRCIQARKTCDELPGLYIFCSVHNRMFITDRLAYGVADECKEEYSSETASLQTVKKPNQAISVSKKSVAKQEHDASKPALLKKQIIKKIK